MFENKQTCFLLFIFSCWIVSTRARITFFSEEIMFFRMKVFPFNQSKTDELATLSFVNAKSSRLVSRLKTSFSTIKFCAKLFKFGAYRSIMQGVLFWHRRRLLAHDQGKGRWLCPRPVCRVLLLSPPKDRHL